MTTTDYGSTAEAREAEAIATRISARADSLAISTAAEYDAAGAFLKDVKAEQQRVEALRDTLLKPLSAAVAAARAIFAPRLQAIADVESKIKRGLLAYQDEQDRIQREEQRKADERARKEQERLQREAAKAEASGKVEKAELLQHRAEQTVAPLIQRAAPKVAGIATREVWKAEVVELDTLVKAIAAGKAPLALVQPNEKVLGAQARSLKKDFIAPGVRVWSEKSIASGAA